MRVLLPEGLEEVEAGLFAGGSLVEVRVPASVREEAALTNTDLNYLGLSFEK